MTRPTKKVRVGLIGAGRIGQVHAEHLRYRIDRAELLAVAEPDQSTALSLAARLGMTVEADYRRLLDDRKIDAVVIASSTDTHARIIEEAAQAGKEIFCEKPIDQELSKIDRALDAVRRAGVKLQIGFNRRFDPNFRRIARAVKAGAVGTPHIVRITSRDPAPPPIDYIKVSGGMFMDMTIHDFDMARFVIGAEVEALTAVGQVRVDDEIGQAGDIDTAVLTLQFKGGTICTIDNSRQAVYGYDQRLEVFGSGGCLAAENETHDRVSFLDKTGAHSALPLDFFMTRYSQSYLEEMQSFVDCIVHDRVPEVTGDDGRAPVLLAMAALRAMRERCWVDINEVGLNAVAAKIPQ